MQVLQRRCGCKFNIRRYIGLASCLIRKIKAQMVQIHKKTTPGEFSPCLMAKEEC
jgi:hypothetical protein